MKKFFCICFSSTLQRTITFNSVQLEHVNRSEHYRIDASGKAVNSARILAQLERDCVTTFCPLGINNYKDFEFLAKNDNLNLMYMKISGNTRECWTLLDKTKGTTTELVVSEPVFKPTKEFKRQEKQLLQVELPINIEENDAVLLAGSRPSVWSDEAYPLIAKAAVDAGKIFLADYHGKDLLETLKICTPTIIKINEEEFLSTFCDKQKKSESESESESEEQLKSLIIQKSKELKNIIIVTRGTESTFAAKNGDFAECPIISVKAVNTTACGDSFNAGFLYEYTYSGDFEKALQKGTWCAARNAENECPGTIQC